MPNARGIEGRWFADIDDLRLRDVPCVTGMYNHPSRIGFTKTLALANEDEQKSRYVAAINRKQVIIAISFPDNPNDVQEGFTRFGYDALWTIIPDVVTENIIRFWFDRKICDLYRSGKRVPGYPPASHPAYERSRWPGLPPHPNNRIARA